ncbi:TRAP transporter substrate-binding protein [Streptomyces olivochromogenes]|uniref:TRAP transporter substrate-binding protein n=1 Tax=Streptomyces olivochromogenes TaxID=1963 RepID=UPI001F464981|nr:hypothetical protein [Streptomyces olivochromogenes]MCF3132074.1 hypothetical protein [Streptomyces olivochromogenes]
MRSRRLWAGLGAVTALLVASGCGGSVDKAGGGSEPRPTVLRMFSGLDEVEPFIQGVGEVSEGELRIDRIHSKHGESGEADLIRAVRDGRYDLAVVPVRAWHGAGVSDFDALVAPLAVDSYALQQKVLDGDIGATMLKGVRKVGVDGIGILPGPMRKPVGITRSLRGPEDYRGARIGAAPSAVAARTLRTLGARPVPRPFYGASIAGLDGVEHQVLNVEEDRYDATAESITANVNLWPRPAVVVANPKRLRTLSGDQRGDLRRASHAAVESMTTEIRQAEADEGSQALCQRGRVRFETATAAQLAHLRKAVEPVHAWLREDARTRGYLDRIRALRHDTKAARDAEIPSCEGQGTNRSPTERSALDGTYRMTTSEDELVAAGAAGDEAKPENWGDFRLVFAKGRFAFTTENGEACVWAYGEFTVRDRQLTLTVGGGGGTSPNHATNQFGERFVFQWSAYRDLLTLAGVKGQVSPTPFRVKPWRRINDTPDDGLLSRKCPPPAAAFTG